MAKTAPRALDAVFSVKKSEGRLQPKKKGRPPKAGPLAVEERAMLTIRVTPEQRKACRALALARDLTLQDMMAEVVADFLDKNLER